MTEKQNEVIPDDRSSSVAEIVLSDEHLSIGTVRAPYRKVRISKRVVVETKRIEVDVRREEIVIEEFPPDDESVGQPDDHRVSQPLVLVLHEEKVEVSRRVVPVERVVVTIESIRGEVDVTTSLRSEHADLVMTKGSYARDVRD